MWLNPARSSLQIVWLNPVQSSSFCTAACKSRSSLPIVWPIPARSSQSKFQETIVPRVSRVPHVPPRYRQNAKHNISTTISSKTAAYPLNIFIAASRVCPHRIHHRIHWPQFLSTPEKERLNECFTAYYIIPAANTTCKWHQPRRLCCICEFMLRLGFGICLIWQTYPHRSIVSISRSCPPNFVLDFLRPYARWGRS